MLTDPNRERSTLWMALGFAWQLGYTVAIPLVLLTLGGRLLDKHFGTHPWLLITGVILSIIISTAALIIRATGLIAQMNPPKPSVPPKPLPHDHDDLPRR